MVEREWLGRNVRVQVRPDHGKPVIVQLNERSARDVALCIAKVKQDNILPAGVEELLLALNYVLVADPHSVSEHKRMEASKGMTPDGGYKTPGERRDG